MNILIVSYEAWRETNNGGNVLSNIFAAFPDAALAQVYCCGEQPQNGVCRKYFQISDGMLLTKEKGRILPERDYSVDDGQRPEGQVKEKIPAFLKEGALLARELLWTVANWRSRALRDFVLDFQPDVIFAPCYSYYHVSRLALYIKKIARCPMISYISDDNASLKQFRLSSSFWINRLITRKWIRRHLSRCELVYTMTRMQKREYEAAFGCRMKILCKSAEFEPRSRETGDPIQLIYGGGLYLNRWKILAKIRDVLEELNQNGVRAQLHIYSGSKLSPRRTKLLSDGENAFLHQAIGYGELMERYRHADIAIHAEAFDLKNRLITRLSFSTKIIDCMSSGCAILAVGPEGQAGLSYLRDNDAAVCVSDTKALYGAISDLVEHREKIAIYARKACELGRRNHDRSKIEEELRRDFEQIVHGADARDQDRGSVMR